jgi:Zn-dependent alcohol dehydrogenase
MDFVGLGAAWKVADVEEGSTVVIFGLGAVGLAVHLFQININYICDDFV